MQQFLVGTGEARSPMPKNHARPDTFAGMARSYVIAGRYK